MPFAERILIALRTLIDDDPHRWRSKRRRQNVGVRGNTRSSRQTAAIILTFRDLFTSSGLNAILDEVDRSRRPSRRWSRNSFTTSSRSSVTSTHRPRLTSMNHIVPISIPVMEDPQEESVPLLFDETESAECTMLVPTCNVSNFSNSLFSSLILGKKDKLKDITVPLDTDDEEKTLKTLRKVIKWSPRKRNSAKFSVPLPREDGHVALAVVQNAVNTVKEEQHRKKKKFFFFKLC